MLRPSPSPVADCPHPFAMRLSVSGVVQGVGFRPFVYGLATRLDLKGWVCNTSSGVVIEIEGCPDAMNDFRLALTRESPPLARIEHLAVEPSPFNNFTHFEIRESASQVGAFQPISPDISICPDCLRELFDPKDRRYLYPFINCTNCGPRFTIIKDIPYDRPKTTMASFEMCDDCAREYHDPFNRRFHTQPVACPKCGPKITLVLNKTSTPSGVPSEARNEVEGRDGLIASAPFDFAANTTPLRSGRLRLESQSALEEAQRLLAEGKIIAVKGLGGFHLACDATNKNAVAELRRRKGRIDKPFALMMPDIETVERYCYVSFEERILLESRECPVVLLQKRDAVTPAIADSVAPHQHTLGVMLPYTPLHYLLMADSKSRIANSVQPSAISHPLSVLVMTSGNFSDEPIATRNDEAITRLAPLADAFLLHDRDIQIRTDDSVVRIFENQELPIRRSRGYAPYPVKLPFNVPPLLAVGGELKNTFCVARDHYAFMSHHIGDMENLETLKSFEEGADHFQNLFRIAPEIVAYDLHPDYLSTRYAQRLAANNQRLIPVQHHHAHIASCLAENHHKGNRSVIGVAFDGTGYGSDGAIWGGEFLIADYKSFDRAAHLAYIPLPGGDAATRKPARVALSHLLAANLSLDLDLPTLAALSPAEQNIIAKQIANGLNSPLTSSMGRLFDAVASIIGVRQEVNYEGQAAIELEAISDPIEKCAYPFAISHGEIIASTVIQSVVSDFRAGVPPPTIAARFHNGVAMMIRNVCVHLREQYAINQVALSGGVFQNITLLGKTLKLLHGADFEVFTHHLVPPNDGGIALGQAAIAARQISD